MPALQPLLARFLHVRRTELGRTLQVAGFALVLGWALYTAFNASQAIFLARSGPQAYPLFFIILALAVWPMVTLQGAVTRRIGVGPAIRINLGVQVVLAIAIYGAYRIDESPFVAFTSYVIYSVAFELLMLLFWQFVSQHFNLLEGKRIFPVIAAGSSVGYILAGLTTTILAVFATELLMFVWMIGAAICLVLSLWLERRLFRPAFDDDAEQFHAEEHLARRRLGAVAALRGALAYLTSSPLVLSLVLLALVLQVASRIGDYLVALIFVKTTHGNLQDLTILIGNAWLASYVVQLGVSLFITPWVLDKLGVKNAIMALPVFTLIGFAAVAVSPILATSLFLFIVRNGLQTGLDDPAENVLSGALPAQVGPKLTFLLNNAVLPGAAVLTGFGLLVVQRVTSASIEVLALVGIVVACLFILAALRVRGLYVSAIYERLRTHAISLGDFQRAVGSPSSEQVGELQGYVRTGDPKARQFAAAALGKIAPEAFASMLPELVVSDDAFVRRLAFQMAPPEALTSEQLSAAMNDEDGWVRGAVGVAGSRKHPPWELAGDVLRKLGDSVATVDRAAAVWAASFLGDRASVLAAFSDADPRVRLEGLRSFAKLKGDVPNSSQALIACVRDGDVEVRRTALREALRWSPSPGDESDFARALVEGLTSGDVQTRQLAAQAMAVQSPAALEQAMPFLESRDDAAAATIEALIRSGRPELFARARGHLERQMTDGVHLAGLRARLSADDRSMGNAAASHDFLRVTLDDYVRFVAGSGLAAMRALHGKRGFAVVERGVLSTHEAARAEGVETLLNFGPGWLAAPLAQLLDRESFDATRGLSKADVEALERHPDKWVQEGARAVANGPGELMKELIALKLVPLFSELTLEQLSSIDRLMVTRHYVKGETLFRRGDVGSELFVVLEGEVRVHLDTDGREVTLAMLGPNNVLGEMAAFDDQPRSASAVATVNTTVRVLRRDRLQMIVHEHPEVLLEFIKNLTQRIREMDEKLREAETRTPRATPAGVGEG